jgi:thioredoxin 1
MVMVGTCNLGPMKATSALALLTLLLAGCGSQSAAPTVPDDNDIGLVKELTSANFAAVALSGQGVVMVEFYRTTCPFCQSMIPTVQQVAQDFAGRAVVARVETTNEPGLASTYGVTAVPTFIFFRGGKEIRRSVGSTSREVLEGLLDQTLSGS